MPALTAKDVMQVSPVIPVVKLDNVDDAVSVAQALKAGGIDIIEVTLRTAVAFECIKAIADAVEGMLLGAGTVTTAQQLEQSVAAGARFALSPGLTPGLLTAAQQQNIPFIPGINTVSDIMLGREYKLQHFKFFPAEYSGGVNMLNAFSALFDDVYFCPTGGINQHNMHDYLALDHVLCVGGSWLVSQQLVAEKNWSAVTMLAKDVFTK